MSATSEWLDLEFMQKLTQCEGKATMNYRRDRNVILVYKSYRPFH